MPMAGCIYSNQGELTNVSNSATKRDQSVTSASNPITNALTATNRPFFSVIKQLLRPKELKMHGENARRNHISTQTVRSEKLTQIVMLLWIYRL